MFGLTLQTIGWIVLGIGVFFMLEGAGNLVWWYINPPTDNVNVVWQSLWEVGRVFRVILGIALIALGLKLTSL
jgi:hypothetical protein